MHNVKRKMKIEKKRKCGIGLDRCIPPEHGSFGEIGDKVFDEKTELERKRELRVKVVG